MVETLRPEASAEGLSQATADSRHVYEVGFHLVPTVGEDGVAAVVEKIRKLLGDAEIIAEHFPQKMTLAYTIERATQGPSTTLGASKREKYSESYFGSIKFATEREALPALAEALRAMKEVLRFLLIETVREEAPAPARRAVFTSSRLEGEVLQKPVAREEKGGEVSEEELDKSIEALVS